MQNIIFTFLGKRTCTETMSIMNGKFSSNSLHSHSTKITTFRDLPLFISNLRVLNWIGTSLFSYKSFHLIHFFLHQTPSQAFLQT